MGITINSGGLKTVSEIKINPSGTLRNVIEVWENVNGVLKQVWPDTAYDGSHFAGELRGGVITNVYSRPSSGNLGHNYVFMNDKVAVPGGGSGYYDPPTPITSGGLYRNVDNPRGTQYPENTFGQEFGFISAAKIDYTKYSKVRMTGKVKYTFYAVADQANAVYWYISPTIEQVHRYSATEQPGRYVRRNSVKGDDFAYWFGVKINAGSVGYSGDLPFDVTFDISAWNTNTDQIAFYFDPTPDISVSGSFLREIMNFNLYSIEFIK